ncbi:MAG: hypothetical protein FWG11_05525 [Promicromonosporaceae bacterium]|nr:hypothetical protein [Promicromonosporaceae bacterium]
MLNTLRSPAPASSVALAALAALALTFPLLGGCAATSQGGTSAETSLIDTSSVLLPLPSGTLQQIEHEKTLFWANLRELPPTTYEAVSLTEVHTGPGDQYDIVTIMTHGSTVVVDGQVGHWLRLADGSGFVSSLNLLGQAWSTSVVGHGDEAMVNECFGGLVDFDRLTATLGRPYLVINSYCGGEPLLEATVGDLFYIDGVAYRLIEVLTVGLTGNATAVEHLPGDALLHVQDLVNGKSLVLAVEAVPAP